jgi:hypothetical protein
MVYLHFDRFNIWCLLKLPVAKVITVTKSNILHKVRIINLIFYLKNRNVLFLNKNEHYLSMQPIVLQIIFKLDQNRLILFYVSYGRSLYSMVWYHDVDIHGYVTISMN